MASGFFTANLAVFAVITTAATLGQSYLRQQRKAAAAAAASPASASTALGNAADTLSVGDSVPQPGGRRASLQHAGQQSGSTRSLWRAYIVVYALVMGELGTSEPHPKGEGPRTAIARGGVHTADQTSTYADTHMLYFH